MMTGMFDLFEELRSVVTAFDAAGVAYALCGGVALAVHGAPRATKDIDLLVEPAEFEHVREILRGCGYQFDALPMHFAASGLDIRRVSKIMDRDLFTVDLLLVNEALTKIWLERERTSFDGRPLWVVTREGLITLKLTAGRPQDLADVVKLKEQE